MQEKDFSFESTGPCEDWLDTSLMEDYETIIKSINASDSGTVIEFKIAEACCQEFRGDYVIKKDTLVFHYEQVNEEMCSCICWYPYLLKIRNTKESFSAFRAIPIHWVSLTNDKFRNSILLIFRSRIYLLSHNLWSNHLKVYIVTNPIRLTKVSCSKLLFLVWLTVAFMCSVPWI